MGPRHGGNGWLGKLLRFLAHFGVDCGNGQVHGVSKAPEFGRRLAKLDETDLAALQTGVHHLDDDHGNKRRQDDEVTMSDVNQAHHPKDDGQSSGKQGIKSASQDALEDCIYPLNQLGELLRK